MVSARWAAVLLNWASVSGKTYSILCAIHPGVAFTPMVTNLNATPPLNTYTAYPSGDAFYFRLAIP